MVTFAKSVHEGDDFLRRASLSASLSHDLRKFATQQYSRTWQILVSHVVMDCTFIIIAVQDIHDEQRGTTGVVSTVSDGSTQPSASFPREVTAETIIVLLNRSEGITIIFMFLPPVLLELTSTVAHFRKW